MIDKGLEFVIQGMTINPETEDPVVILRDKEMSYFLPITIGPFEASAIIIELENITPPRPLTHDIMADFFRDHNMTLQSLEIYEKYQDIYLSRIHYSRGMKTFTKELRPSDGLALSIRLKAPIFVAPSVYEHTAQKISDLESAFFQETLFLGQKNLHPPYFEHGNYDDSLH